jgi:hypothetical protein
MQEHSERLIEILYRLISRSLGHQHDKCGFVRKELCYLRCRITLEIAKPDERKVICGEIVQVLSNTQQFKGFYALQVTAGGLCQI